MNIHKIGTFEAIALICIVMVNHIIINIPEIIIQSTGSSAWINVIFISIVSIGFTLIICLMFKKFIGKDILDICEFVGRKMVKNWYWFVIYFFVYINLKQFITIFFFST